jgi:UDP-glucuronate 4-epimerase
MDRKRILLTGAAGFIGLHLSLALRKRGDIVVGFDNFSDYYDPTLHEARARLLDAAGVDLIRGDICDKSLLAHTVSEHMITHVVHLAAQPGVRYSLENPDLYIQTNIQGFLNILEVLRSHPSIPLTYASSSSVYGLSDAIPYGLDDRADQQASLYGATKRSNELMAHTYHHLFGIRTTGLRFFTVYGPWGRPDMAPSIFARKILAGEPIDVYNHGKMERDFTFVDDIVDGTIAAIDLEAKCEVFNLGNNRPVQLEYFIDLLEKNLEVKAERNYLPMQPGDVLRTCADIEHSSRRLGYRPTTPLEQGIPQFTDWFRKYNFSNKMQNPVKA